MLVELQVHRGVLFGRDLQLFEAIQILHVGVLHETFQLLDDLFGLFGPGVAIVGGFMVDGL